MRLNFNHSTKEKDACAVLESGVVLGFVSILTILLLACANLPWQLEDYDQAKQAFTSWQMVKSGRLLYQETPSGRVATKPPLAGWISALFYRAVRSWDAAWRLPSFAAALVIAWLLWRHAGALFGPLPAIIAVAAFAFNLLTPRLATLVRTDMPLALTMFLIALLFFEKISTGHVWRSRDRIVLFVLLSASMLIKGPIVYAFVLPAMVLFAWRYRRTPSANALATGWWPWLLSLAIFLAWAIGGIRTVPGFYDEVVVGEFAGRFRETIHQPQPLYFYLPHLLHKFAPWSLLLIGLLAVNFRAARAARVRWLAQLRPEAFWLLAWVVGGLIVMSCIPSKRVDRIYPVLPPMCLLLAALIGAKLAGGERPPLARWCAATLLGALLFTGSYTVFKIVHGFRRDRAALVKCGHEFRRRAIENHWRYGVLKNNTEALVFYFDVPGFMGMEEALARWNAGELDALVATERHARALLPKLQPRGSAQVRELCHSREDNAHFVVVQR